MTIEAPVQATAPVATGPGAPPHPVVEFWRDFSHNKGAVAGLVVIVLVTLTAVFADALAPYSPIQQFREALLKPPVWSANGSWTFPLGTDAVGRDLLSRLIHGAQLSMLIGFIVVTLSLIAGVLLGLIAGFFQGVVSITIMRMMDIVLSLPSILLAIVIVTILGPSLTNAMIAVTVVVTPHYVRLTSASVVNELSKDYVTASKISGAGLLRLMFVTVLPNCVPPLIVQATLGFSTAILDAAALGFLGLGAQPPTAEWGTMLSNAREFVRSAWWVVTFPGVAILVTVLAFNLLGDGLRDALDPKLKR